MEGRALVEQPTVRGGEFATAHELFPAAGGAFDDVEELAFDYREDTIDRDLILSQIRYNKYDVLRQPVSTTDTIIDVGAYIGVFSVLCARLFGCKVVACEPLPENAALIRRNAELNGVSRQVVVEECALWGSGMDVLPIHYGDEAEEARQYRFVGSNTHTRSPYEPAICTALTLKKLMDLHEIANCRFLKMDCEGAEWGVLQTAVEDGTMARVGKVACEFHPFPYKGEVYTTDAAPETLGDPFMSLGENSHGVHTFANTRYGR
jgi:FkbM family methyltransferase